MPGKVSANECLPGLAVFGPAPKILVVHHEDGYKYLYWYNAGSGRKVLEKVMRTRLVVITLRHDDSAGEGKTPYQPDAPARKRLAKGVC